MSGNGNTGEIVRGSAAGLVKGSSALVRRGLRDLSALPEPRRRRILVSHEEAVNEVLERLLCSAGYAVRVAPHSSDVLGLAESFGPDIVLLQLIAEVDAIKLSEQLARAFPRVKIIILGPLVGEELNVTQWLRKKGITCSFLELPFDRNEQLFDIVQSQFD